ncbi:MAG: hypothetical protein HQ504_00810 [Rhodospirillaceae bacterium]|nr:hypothetical protein [Rhodospirillaceae bacterium]
MPSRHVASQGSNTVAERPFAIFYVNKRVPEEIHTETVMAEGPDQACAIAAEKHRQDVILHVRAIGEPNGDQATSLKKKTPSPLPGARFIKGEFRAVPFNDELLLETVPD